mmetsp:Transcript_2564/g.6036  ORF Transcript_2564/g.6036 Transcript_2564/m.6036 type:complete len:251 (+) Transcript_2564:2805-3557(+)
MAFRWIDDVEGLGFDDGIFGGGKDASFDGSRRRRSRGTGATGLALTRDGIASPSSSSRSGTAFPSAAMTASTTMPSLSVVTLRLRGICFFAKIVARIRRRGAEGAAGAILGGIGGVVQTGIAAVVGGIAFGGAASSSSVTGATGGADASSGGGMATGASISSLLLLLLLLLRLWLPRSQIDPGKGPSGRLPTTLPRLVIEVIDAIGSVGVVVEVGGPISFHGEGFLVVVGGGGRHGEDGRRAFDGGDRSG